MASAWDKEAWTRRNTKSSAGRARRARATLAVRLAAPVGLAAAAAWGLVAPASALALALPANCTSAGATVTCSYHAPGSYTLGVPVGVTAARSATATRG